MKETPMISVDTLREMLSNSKPVNIIDIRPMGERSEWFIPGSIYVDVYDKLKNGDATAMSHIFLDRAVPVVTVCAGGKTSMIAADLLAQEGYSAFSLQQGMKGWSLAWNLAHQRFSNFEVWQIRRTGKGCLSYVLSSSGEALIVDASLPLDVYVKVIEANQLHVKCVIETHIHADHLSRSRELAQHFQVPLYLPVPNKVQFEFCPIVADTSFSIGSTTLLSIPTPGHTLDSFSFYVKNNVIFTGDTLFTNAVGRPDLKSAANETRERATKLYQSLHKLLALPENVIVFPAHTSTPVDFDETLVDTTIGLAKRNIPLLQVNEAEFTETILQKLPPTPPNYVSITEKNSVGHYEDINPVDLEAGANRCAIS